MKIKNFNKGIISSSVASFWWGVIGTYYFQYKTDDKESLKRISINEKNTKTSEITVPDHDEHPAYFFLRNCEAEITKEPIQVDFQEDTNKKVS